MNTLYHYMADILAGCYAVTHNYALAIALLTLAVVAVTTPLTWKSTRGMLAMQMLAPEIKKLQQKYKGDKEALNQEMMALYKENNINPLAGCLPLLPQMLVFFVLYRTIYNLAHRAVFKTLDAAQAACPKPTNGFGSYIVKGTGATPFNCSSPQNVSKGSLIYHNLVNSGGHMKVWGFDLTLGVRTAHGSAVIGCWVLVVLVVAAYWFQTKQMSSRNPAAAQANPQMQTMQKIFPFFFGFISITIQAGVNVYFLVSALCRIGQQSLMYRHDPVLRRHVENAKKATPIDAKSTERKGFFASLQEAFGPTSTAPPNRGGSRPPGRQAQPPPRQQRQSPPPRSIETSSSPAPIDATASGPPPPAGPATGPSSAGSSESAPAPDAPSAPASGSRWSRIWAVASGADAAQPAPERASRPVRPPRSTTVSSSGSSGNGSGNGAVSSPTPPSSSPAPSSPTSSGPAPSSGARGAGGSASHAPGNGSRQANRARNRARRKRARRSR